MPQVVVQARLDVRRYLADTSVSRPCRQESVCACGWRWRPPAIQVAPPDHPGYPGGPTTVDHPPRSHVLPRDRCCKFQRTGSSVSRPCLSSQFVCSASAACPPQASRSSTLWRPNVQIPQCMGARSSSLRRNCCVVRGLGCLHWVVVLNGCDLGCHRTALDGAGLCGPVAATRWACALSRKCAL